MFDHFTFFKINILKNVEGDSCNTKNHEMLLSAKGFAYFRTMRSALEINA